MQRANATAKYRGRVPRANATGEYGARIPRHEDMPLGITICSPLSRQSRRDAAMVGVIKRKIHIQCRQVLPYTAECALLQFFEDVLRIVYNIILPQQLSVFI